MPVSRRESCASRFWSLQTQLSLPFFAVDDGDEFPPGDDDEPFSDSWPVISGGEARRPLGKVYGAPGEYTLGLWMPGSFVIVCAWEGEGLVPVSHRRGLARLATFEPGRDALYHHLPPSVVTEQV
jgi:hypothetical protein